MNLNCTAVTKSPLAVYTNNLIKSVYCSLLCLIVQLFLLVLFTSRLFVLGQTGFTHRVFKTHSSMWTIASNCYILHVLGPDLASMLAKSLFRRHICMLV
jgi:hypothetical protein